MGSLKFGVHRELEAVANELLRQSLMGVTSMAAKSDLLTPWKEQDRKNREVYSNTGTADPSLRRGMYHRAWNSRDAHLNSRDGSTRGHRTGTYSDVDTEGHNIPWTPLIASEFEAGDI
jgi:hypothetical protein